MDADAGPGTGRSQPHRIAGPRIDPRRTLFERTEAFQRYGARTTSVSGGEHHYAKALIVEQGFDDLPHVVPARELDSYVRGGEAELFRGVSAARYADQLRYGELYVGQGAYGGGIYASGGPDGRQHAADYAQDPGSVVVRMSVKGGAKIGDAAELDRMMRRERRQAQARSPRGGSAWQAVWAKTEVLGLYAAYLGYDGLSDPETGVWLIVNRTALRIQAEDILP